MSMSQHGGFRGKFKGRSRHAPYSRGGGGGPGYRKGRKNNDDGSDTSFQETGERPLLGEVPGHNTELPPPPPPSNEVPESMKKEQKVVSHDLATPLKGWGPGRGQDAGGHTLASSGLTPSQSGPGPEGHGSSAAREKKYSVKARLFVGNLPKETHQDVVKKMFEEFGEVKEVFVQREKNFGFIRMAYKSEAECAVEALDGYNFKGREMKVRFAASNSSVKVSNLHPTVSNELLEEAFMQFGEVEKAVVVADERGKSLGFGIVDFSRKGYAQNAIRRCSEEHFILTKSPMPILVAEYIRDNDEEGQPEKYIPKNTTYRVEREVPPRFVMPNSLEHAVATQWKMAYDSEKRQRDELEQHLRQGRNNLVNEMESIKEQHQTELLRQELAHHQQEQLRLVQQLRMRQGPLMPPGAQLMEPNGSGGVASLFPSQPGPGEMPAEQQQMPGMPGMDNFGSFPAGGGAATIPGLGSGTGLLPQPLMGQADHWPSSSYK